MTSLTQTESNLEQRIRLALRDDRVAFSLLVLAGALALSLIALSDTFFRGNSSNYLAADLYKISLFSSGESPYSVEPWAASYPPLYFLLWGPVFLALGHLFSPASFSMYLALQCLSTAVFAASSYVLYRTLSSESRSEAISLASIYFICCLSALIALVGDAFGILFLSLGCFLLVSRKSELAGFFLISLAVAFKVHPVIGALLFLAYYLRTSKPKFWKALGVFVATLGLFDAIPALFLPDSLSSVVGYHAVNLQLYTFNAYAGALGVASNLLSPSSSFGAVRSTLDAAWLAAVVLTAAAAFFLCLRGRGNYFKAAKPLDLVALGALLWILLLKQTLPHYFLWALLPLLAARRVRSAIFLLLAEGSGLAMFAVGLYVAPSPVEYWLVPSLASSLSFLAGGILFDCFVILAVRSLAAEVAAKNSRMPIGMAAPVPPSSNVI
jgi:hypothetical protein